MLSTMRVAAVVLSVALVQAEEQCMGLKPMDGVSSYLGMSLDYSTANRICCNNHRYAERSGYFAESGRDLFSKLDANGPPTVFYGKPKALISHRTLVSSDSAAACAPQTLCAACLCSWRPRGGALPSLSRRATSMAGRRSGRRRW